VKKCLVFDPRHALPIGIFTGESLSLSSALEVSYEPGPGILMLAKKGLRLALPMVARGEKRIFDLRKESGE